jgi:hypothetical protein
MLGLLVLFGACAAGDIVCPGEYGGHLQGIATDPAHAVYWSFTVRIVKTDAEGRLLASVEAPTHQGDLDWHDGKVYVAVNLGLFNEEPGKADSWVYVYDDRTLALVGKHPVPEVVHGAGGMAWHDGSFYIVGGLPEKHTENYVYQYTADFRFVKRHTVPSGHTHLGIQTVCRGDGCWWFGCYGDPKVLLKTDDKFMPLGIYAVDYSTGIARRPDGAYLQGLTAQVAGKKLWTGRARVADVEKDAKAAPSLPISLKDAAPKR